MLITLTGIGNPRDSDNSNIIRNGAGIPALVHGHIAGCVSGATAEQPDGAKNNFELASLAATVPPAVTGGHKPSVGQHAGTADGGLTIGQSDD